MNWMEDIEKAASTIMVVWGVLALVLGPIAFLRARKFFPERREAITPEQLRAELATFDHNLRDAFGADTGRLRLSMDQNHAEAMGMLRQVQSKAEEARDLATQAGHKADLVEERVNGLDRHLIDKLRHIEDTLSQLRQIRRGDAA